MATAPTSEKPDPLGKRPQLGPPATFQAPRPEVFTTAQGLTVWLLERPKLPLVSLQLSVPYGSSSDPQNQAGLAAITAAMLDEGAGTRGAIAISAAIDDLGASLSSGAGIDGSRVGLMVLKKHLSKAFEIFADVVARPTFPPEEWQRVSELWVNQLRRRGDSPAAVASLVARAIAYGSDSSYGHPAGGTVASVEGLSVGDAKAFHKEYYRPDQAHLVVAGSVTRAEVEQLIATHLQSWKAPADPAPKRLSSQTLLEDRPRLVLVDRPNAPQSVIQMVLPGLAAKDKSAPLLELISAALGGSFTSRLNQNLREDKAWSYGASTALPERRGQGAFVARVSVKSQVTGPAIAETLAEFQSMAKDGLRPTELRKVKARDLAELVETNETLTHMTWRLSSLAVLGLDHAHDTTASRARQQATPAQLAAIAARFCNDQKATVIVVGPAEQIRPQLASLGLGEPQMWLSTGKPSPED